MLQLINKMMVFLKTVIYFVCMAWQTVMCDRRRLQQRSVEAYALLVIASATGCILAVADNVFPSSQIPSLQSPSSESSRSSLPDEAFRHGNSETTIYHQDKPEVFLREHAVNRGLGNWADLKMIRTFLHQALEKPKSRVLEIGAGEGRVVDWLLKEFRDTSITALEKEPKLVEFLKKKYARTTVNVVQGDILTFRPATPVDVALWMWSGILELNHHGNFQEKQRAFSQVFEALKPGGTLVVDISNDVPEVFERHGGYVEMSTGKNEIFRAWLIPPKDLAAMGSQAGFAFQSRLTYLTSSGQERVILIFQKPLSTGSL